MRRFMIAAVPLIAGAAFTPAQAQVSARVHIDIPIGRQQGPVYGSHRQLVVREYDPYRFGTWDQYYDEWIPETVYYYDGYYYDYPIVAYAQPIIVYRYRNEIFFAPRQREFITWRDRYRPQNYNRNYRWDPRNNGRYDPRYGGQYQAPRNGGQYQPPRNGNDRPGQPQRDGRDGRDGRDDRRTQPQQGGRDNRDARPTQPQAGRDIGQGRSGGDAGAGRDAGRARPRGH